MTKWDDLVIPSDDGVPLEAWYIPAKGEPSDKLIIFNHPLPMCRAGFPGHLGEPRSNCDGVEIDFFHSVQTPDRCWVQHTYL